MRYSVIARNILPLLLLFVVFQGCDCIRGQLGMPTSGEIERMKEQMRVKEEEERAALEREKFVQDSLARVAQQSAVKVVEGYHVIVGCFKDYSNADAMEKKMKDAGYNAMQIPLKNGYMMVSLGSLEKLGDAVRLMEKVSDDSRISYFDEIWVYGASQGLHKEN